MYAKALWKGNNTQYSSIANSSMVFPHIWITLTDSVVQYPPRCLWTPAALSGDKVAILAVDLLTVNAA